MTDNGPRVTLKASLSSLCSGELKLGISELWLLSIALLQIMFYQCMKFQDDSFSSLEDVAQKKIPSGMIIGQLLKNLEPVSQQTLPTILEVVGNV